MLLLCVLLQGCATTAMWRSLDRPDDAPVQWDNERLDYAACEITAIRGGTARSEFGETSEALFLTSGYAYDCAGDAAARFAGEQQGMTYSRLQNPTVEMLEQRIALQERLNAAGFDVGTPDGIIGSKTEAAVTAYQQARGLPVTGQPSVALLRSLGG